MVPSLFPTPVTEGMMATEMPEVISPYSTALVPDLSFRKRRIMFNIG